MKLVPPVVIDDTNMVSNAPDDDYPVWGTTKRLVEYQMPDTTLVNTWHVWENPENGDVYMGSGRNVYKQAGGTGAFVPFAKVVSTYSIMDMSGNPNAGYLYCVINLSSLYFIVAINLETGAAGPNIASESGGRGVIRSITADLTDGRVYYAAAVGIRYTDATLADAPTVHDATRTDVYSLRIHRQSDTMYALTQGTGGNVYKYPSMTTTASIHAAFAYGLVLCVTDPGDIYVMASGSRIYVDAGATGTFSDVPEYYTGASTGVSESPRFNGVYVMSMNRIINETFVTGMPTVYLASESLFFNEGEYCISGTGVYVSLVENNIAETSDSTKWFLHSSLNRLRMFDSQLTTKTEVSGMDLIVTFTSNEIDTIGLFNVVGASVTVIVTNGWGVVESSTQAVSTRNVVFENLPSNINAVYQVIITPLNGVASCGNMVAGMSNAIGTLMRDVELSLVSYSKTTIDDFGRPSFTVRGRAKKLECVMRVEKTDSNRVYELFNQNDAKLCMWVGPSGYPHLTVFGWYQRFELQLGAADTAKYNLEIQGDVDTLATETSPSLATPGALEIVEAYLSVEGNGVFLLFNRAAYVGAGGSGGFVVTIGEIDYPLTYVSGDGTNAFLFEFSGDFFYDDAAVVDYTQPGNGIEDSDGEDLVVSTLVPLGLLYGGVHPTVVSITIAENGTTVTIFFDLPVSIGTGGSGGFTLNGAALTYVSGLPGNTAVFSVAAVLSGITVAAAYVQPGDGIEQVVSGLDLISFSGVSVVNNSTQTDVQAYTWPFDDNTSSSAIVCTENSAYNMTLLTQVNTADAWDSVRGGIDMKGTGESIGREARTWLGDVGLGVGATLWAVELEFTLNEAVPSGVTPGPISLSFSDSNFGLALYYYPLTGQYRLFGGYVNEYATSTYALVVGTTYKLTLERPAGGATLVVSLVAGGATAFEHTFAVTDTGTDISGITVGSASSNAYLPATVTNLKVTSTGV